MIDVIFLSLVVSGSATVLAGIVAIPAGIFLSLREFRFKRVVIWILNTFLAVPAVLIGLVVYMFLSRKGPAGPLGLLYTPYAMMIAQAILATPIICALSLSAIKSLAKETSETARSLGADTGQVVITIIKQGRFAFLSAVIMGFSRVIGETGMTLMVGGNIKGFTRVMTTTIALETTKGNFETGIALGIVLFFVAVIINVFFQLLQGE